MLWYSFLEKRGDYIKKAINLSLLSNGFIIIDKKIECEYIVDKFVKYEEDNNTSNYINLEDKIYIRENNEFMFKIDFNKSLFNYILKENNINIEDKIECSFIKDKDKIILNYKLDEEKRIIIHLL